MREEIRKHQKGRDSKEGERIVGGKHVLFERRCREEGSFFFFFVPLLFP